MGPKKKKLVLQKDEGEKRPYCPKGERWDITEQKCISLELWKQKRENKKKKNFVIKGPVQVIQGVTVEPVLGVVIKDKPKKKLILKEVVELGEKELDDDDDDELGNEIVLDDDDRSELASDHDTDYDEEELDTINTDYDEEELELLRLFNTNKKQFYIEKERIESRDQIERNNILYPQVGDPLFNQKIATKKEFYDTKYDGNIYDIKQKANQLCNSSFELMPHQLFVKNFMSVQTPYNSLLLYHNLGTGKTCSAIGVAEEMRQYMKSVGYTQKILVVASPNVQDNFRSQLFDKSKLVKINGKWNLDTCIGNSLIKEINPSSLINLERKKLIAQMKQIINTYYEFMGYTKLALYIDKKIHIADKPGQTPEEKERLEVQRIKAIFSNRLIIIDEVHNIRITSGNDKQAEKTASLLMNIAKWADNIRLLVLSATPAFNSYKEIIWLTNLLNAVDKRAMIEEREVFKSDGQFQPATEDRLALSSSSSSSGGEALLRKKLTGYVSYVRGENPYTFPYRIYPAIFSPENALQDGEEYPQVQMNQQVIDQGIQYIPVYVSRTIDPYQQGIYNAITAAFSQEGSASPSFENMEKKGGGAFLLRTPLQALNMVYPDDKEDAEFDTFVGKKGLQRCFNIETKKVGSESQNDTVTYEYKLDIVAKFGRIFSREHIGKYSHKIATICNCIRKSKGIILVYSEYIDGGIIPLALALEEMGMKRYGSANYTKSLFKNKPVVLQEEQEAGASVINQNYVMITGNASYSPDNLADVKYITSRENRNGDLVKVVLISRAAAEGLDFKNIRQVHILEPWYNMNRIEQIIGRGVRNLSHCSLPFEDRNVEIYLHATRLRARNGDMGGQEEEAADLYMYRYAEKKAIQIGKVTRLLKEIAVDCVLNIAQTELTVEKLLANAANQEIEIHLSSKPTILTPFQVGDKPFTHHCDYMEQCNFVCSPLSEREEREGAPNIDTYNVNYIKMNFSAVQKGIRDLFRERSQYDRSQLFHAMNRYPIQQILYTLSYMISTDSETIKDKFGRVGRIVNKGKYYVFSPLELTDPQASLFDRTIPIDYKRDRLLLQYPNVKVGKMEDSPSDKSVVKEPEKDQVTYESLLLDIGQRFEDSITLAQIGTKDTDWFRNMGRVFVHLKTKHGLTDEVLHEYIVHHYLDILPIEHRLLFLERLFYHDNNPKGEGELLYIEQFIKQYFEQRIMTKGKGKGNKAIILADKDEYKVYIKDEIEHTWTLGRTENLQEFGEEIKKQFVIPITHMHDMLGFIGYNLDDGMTFIMKDFTKTRNNSGGRCSVLIKSEILKRLNNILGGEVYKDTDKETKEILKPGICVILEIIMREKNKTADTGETYFLNAEQALINKIKSKNKYSK
uniref:Helicase ATP-binding domain-containing protein n=1 Tax=viral metagenome TaxID=1070528 RepID=A0A6C0I486_9ZZZZ